MRILSIAYVLATLPMTLAAEVSEMSQAELRSAISESRAIPTRSLIGGVENYTGGEVVDIRAFVSDGAVLYRILYRDTDSQIRSLLVDGASGRAVNPASGVGQEVVSYVNTNPGNGLALGRQGGNNGQANSRGRDNNNGRGNSGGSNRGGNGNGNGRDK